MRQSTLLATATHKPPAVPVFKQQLCVGWLGGSEIGTRSYEAQFGYIHNADYYTVCHIKKCGLNSEPAANAPTTAGFLHVSLTAWMSCCRTKQIVKTCANKSCVCVYVGSNKYISKSWSKLMHISKTGPASQHTPTNSYVITAIVGGVMICSVNNKFSPAFSNASGPFMLSMRVIYRALVKILGCMSLQ